MKRRLWQVPISKIDKYGRRFSVERFSSMVNSGVPMANDLKPANASRWLLEQQMRAELEAEAWRLLREKVDGASSAPGTPALSAPLAPAGSFLTRILVRAALAVGCGYLAWLASVDSGMGEFEALLATGAGIAVSLALSVLEPGRRLVGFIAKTLAWIALTIAGFAGLWVLLHAAGPAGGLAP